MVKVTAQNYMLEMQANHINELLKAVGVDIGVGLDWAYGRPRLVSGNGSHSLSMSDSKPNLEATLYAIKQILYEIGRVQRQDS